MSSLKFHTIQSVLTSAALYPIIGDKAIPFGIAAVLIDLDHVAEYVRDTKCLDVRGLFTYSKLTELNLDKNFLVLSGFHTLECFALVAILAWFSPVCAYVLAGMAYHVITDIIHLVRLGHPFARAYSIIEYVYRSKKSHAIITMHELLKKQEITTAGVRDFEMWKQRWQNARSGLRKEHHL